MTGTFPLANLIVNSGKKIGKKNKNKKTPPMLLIKEERKRSNNDDLFTNSQGLNEECSWA